MLHKRFAQQYVEPGSIPVDIGKQFCKQVDISLYEKTRTLIGFENSAGGYDLRSPDFKASSSPKASTYFDNSKKVISVFEGFFDYLSYQTLHHGKTPLTNFLVLYSLSFFEKEKVRMDPHAQVHLYLDRDLAGVKYTRAALKSSIKFIDKSHQYRSCKDLNEWLMERERPGQRESHGLGRHF